MKSASGDGNIILSVDGVAVRFGGIIALDGVSFDVRSDTITGLIGPNGAGKTTLFNCFSRLVTPVSGDIAMNGRTILDLPAHGIAAAGIGRTFQNLALFPTMSVLDNVRVGSHCFTKGSIVADALKLPGVRRQEKAIDERARGLIDYLGLGNVASKRVGDLPFGTQKRVELARALATDPTLLLLDEPACGLNHEEVEELGALIRQIRTDRKLAILLVEHHMGLVMAVSDRVVALNFGRKLAEGTPTEIQSNPDVISAYLGGQQ